MSTKQTKRLTRRKKTETENKKSKVTGCKQHGKERKIIPLVETQYNTLNKQTTEVAVQSFYESKHNEMEVLLLQESITLIKQGRGGAKYGSGGDT